MLRTSDMVEKPTLVASHLLGVSKVEVAPRDIQWDLHDLNHRRFAVLLFIIIMLKCLCQPVREYAH